MCSAAAPGGRGEPSRREPERRVSVRPVGGLRFLTGLAALAALVFGAGRAAAHDFWLEPSSFRPAPGETVGIGIFIGSHTEPAEPFARRADHILRFFVAGPDGARSDVGGVVGAIPAGELRPVAAGPHVLAYVSTPSRIELPAAKFEAYLVEEGLEDIVAARKAAGASGKPGRERYGRCAKALLAVGGVSGEVFTRRLGLPLELLPEVDPFALKPGEALPVRLIGVNGPVAGRRVAAWLGAATTPAAAARTDTEGRAILKLPAPGRWLVAAVHMVPAQGGTDDWASLWASLTFELPERPAPESGRK